MIRIFRLQNGEDIIGIIDTEINHGQQNNITITEPMTIDLEYRGNQAGLIMRHWLPVQLIKKNESTISLSSVLTIIEPSDDLCEYYENTVEKIQEILDAKKLVDEMSDEEVDLIMHEFEEMEQQDGYTLH